MRPYVIVSPDFTHVCGGIKFLHRLCHMLNERGFTAYITGAPAPPNFPGYCNTKHVSVLSQAERDEIQHTGIVVYPNIVGGNPLCFDTVVRWELAGLDQIYPNWMTFTYSPDNNFTGKHMDNLFVWYIEECFKPPEIEQRGGPCHVVHKGAHLPRIPETEGGNSRNVWGTSPEQLASIFQSSSIFYTYDDFTNFITEARLCGCPVKIVGYTIHNYESIRRLALSTHAIALPEDEVDIPKLRSELGLFNEAYIKVLDRAEQEFQRFLNMTQETHLPYVYNPYFNQVPHPWLMRHLFRNREA
jgi:hypothetical protein